MLSCSIWFYVPSFFGMGGGLESRCVGRVCGVDGAAWCNYFKSVYCGVFRRLPIIRNSSLRNIFFQSLPILFI